MAERLLKQFSHQSGTDPKAFLTSIASILMHYPVAIGEEVVDPFHGLPSQIKYCTPYDVRQACEAVAERLARIAKAGPPLIPRKQIEGFVSPDPPPGPNGVHPPGTILSNFTEATRLYGRPIGAFEAGRHRVYGSKALVEPPTPKSSR
jgi:hypothetical protein